MLVLIVHKAITVTVDVVMRARNIVIINIVLIIDILTIILSHDEVSIIAKKKKRTLKPLVYFFVYGGWGKTAA